jgi:hypothetical protein
MATPASFSNPAREAEDLNGTTQTAYEQGQDADTYKGLRTHAPLTQDGELEKGVHSKVGSTSDERTLDEENRIKEEGTEQRDPDIVDWDGPDDPENPQVRKGHSQIEVFF